MSNLNDGPRRRALTREIACSLALLFGAAFAVLGLRFALPWLGGYVQALLALALFGVPALVTRRSGTRPEDLGATLAPWGRSVRLALTASLLILPAFVAGFHVFHTQLLGAQATWGWDRVERHQEALLDAPEAPCAASPEAAQAWADGAGLWVVTTGDETLSVDLNDRSIKQGWRLRCAGGPWPERVAPIGAQAQGGVFEVPGGHGLWLPLDALPELDLRITRRGEPAAVVTGAWREGTREPGRVRSSRGGWWLLTFLIVHLGLVALPEEWFFRGYLQGRLDQLLGARRPLFGAPLGWGLVLASAAFALLHPIHIPGAYRLLVFFPGLVFGWLRSRSGNIGAAVIFHALCNLCQEIVAGMYRWP